MKILTGEQIRAADRYTIEHEPIDSIALMERASEKIAAWIGAHVPQGRALLFLAGRGNNGGDALAVARMLYHAGYDCTVVQPFGQNELSPECAHNLHRLPAGVRVLREMPVLAAGVGALREMPPLVAGDDLQRCPVIIDGLLGSGVGEGPLREPVAGIVRTVNASSCRVISIDLPSGMRTESGNAGREMVHADVTLTLQFPKLAQLLPEAGEWCGRLVVLPIGLSPDYLINVPTQYDYLTRGMAQGLLLPRAKFANKGTYGHALLICGSEGMMGAAVLATGGALRSGCGLVTAHVPYQERTVIHCTYPAAILSLDPGECFTTLPTGLARYSAVGVGCGMGAHAFTVRALSALLESCSKPMVLDADALNLLAAHPHLQSFIPAGAILTPHPGELKRLVGEWVDDMDKIARVTEFAASRRVVVVVKGAHTMVCAPSGECYFNSTGTPAMAKGGSGDVLAGLLAGLLARGYEPLQAALLGVYLHGMAGELAAQTTGGDALMSSDIVNYIGEAFRSLEDAENE